MIGILKLQLLFLDIPKTFRIKLKPAIEQQKNELGHKRYSLQETLFFFIKKLFVKVRSNLMNKDVRHHFVPR